MIARRDGATLGHGSGYSKVQGGGWGEVCSAWKKHIAFWPSAIMLCHDFFPMRHWTLRHEKTAASGSLRTISPSAAAGATASEGSAKRLYDEIMLLERRISLLREPAFLVVNQMPNKK